MRGCKCGGVGALTSALHTNRCYNLDDEFRDLGSSSLVLRILQPSTLGLLVNY